jgi:hypothetical protein
MALFTEVHKAARLATETQLSTMVASLGKMGVQWMQLPVDLQSELLRELEVQWCIYE